MKSKILSKLKMAGTASAMADMAFLLLVFFMATTTTEPPKGAKVELPHAITEGAEQDSIYISISNNGDIYYAGNKTSYEELADRLAMRANEKDSVVAITADKNLPYKKVAELLTLLKQKEFLNIVFMAQPKKK